MKNLKRIFSLALAGTMLAGMLTVGASAADFTDADSIKNNEAVDTMVALSIINGKDDGSFAPEATVTRAEMAKMITVALNGGKDPVLGTSATPKYTDIKGHWAEKYIEYCANLGIISGRGDGTFDPNGTVTGTEAAKMVLVAMGYDSTVFKFTGADWAINVNTEAANATPYKLYDEIETIDPNAGLSRDNAAQLIFNGIQDDTMGKDPSLTITNGEISYQFGKRPGVSILTEKYGAKVFIGTLSGNYDTNAPEAVEGEISVYGKLDTDSGKDDEKDRDAAFPSEFGIENIGEEVKVIFKDAKNGTPNQPDAKDTIYGVFNTGKTTVYNTTLTDVTGATGETDSDAADLTKLKIDGTNRNVSDKGIKVYKNFITDKAAATIATRGDAKTNLVDVNTVDTVKFVCGTDGKITTAYIVEFQIAEITNVTSSKVSVYGAGALDPKDHNIYEDAKKGDVVYFSHYYSKDAGKGVYNVLKAETVEGELTGYTAKKDAPGKHTAIAIDDKDYKVNGETLASVVVDKPITADNVADSVGDTVCAYLINGVVAVVDKIEENGGSYAVITDLDLSGSLGSNLNGFQATIMTNDGEETTYILHKESVGHDGKAVTGGEGKANLAIGDFIEYSVSSNKLKIVSANQATKVGSSKDVKIWDEDSKKFDDAVAATGTTLFVAKLDDEGKLTSTYRTYNLRDLGDITLTKGQGAYYSVVDENTGRVKVAYIQTSKLPGGTSADTIYGIVTKFAGTRKVGSETYTRYEVTDQAGATMTINLNTQTRDKVIAVGDVITFEETSDNVYEASTEVFTVIYDAGDDTVTKGWTLGAVESFSDDTLSYWTGTKENDEKNDIFEGTDKKAETYTLSRDVVITYVNTEDNAAGEEIGINSFDANTGKANVIIHVDEEKGIVDVVVVETSGTGFANSAFAIAKKA